MLLDVAAGATVLVWPACQGANFACHRFIENEGLQEPQEVI